MSLCVTIQLIFILQCGSWFMVTLTSREELTHWKRPWCWEGLGAGGEGDDRGWDGWMASRTRWMWVSVNSGSWWWTGRPGMLRFMGLQRVGHNWAIDLIWCNIVLYSIGLYFHHQTHHNWALFPLWLSLLFLLKLYLCSSPVAYWAPTNLGSSFFSVLSFSLFILFMGFLIW